MATKNGKEQERQHKEDALLALYEDAYTRVGQYFFVRTGNRHEAEDLTSETFTRAFKAIDSYEERGLPMEAWLFKIARNLITDYIRKSQKIKMVRIKDEPLSDSTDPEEVAETDLKISRLEKALKCISPDQREVIALRFFSGLSSIECAEVLGRKPGAIREMQRMAVKSLRKQMNAELENGQQL